MELFFGLDLGQRADYSALVGVERIRKTESFRNPVSWAWEVKEEIRLGVVMAERIPLETPYPEVARLAAETVRTCSRMGKTVMGMDITGVGAAVADLIREQDTGKCRVLPVLMTAGFQAHYSGGRYHVPKQDLVAGLVRAMETGVLHAAEGVDLRHLVTEMREFGVKVSQRGQESYEGKKDDLVVALCLAVWAAGMTAPGEPDVLLPGMPGKNWIL